MVQATSHLGSLQALELALRTGSFKAAAEVLHITPAAVGQRVKLLEDYLGIDLLVRGRSGIRPTRELEEALPHLGTAFRELETTGRLLDFQRVHELHIVADSDWADLWLAPRLRIFRAAHTNARFCVNGIGDVPMRLGQADCEIWFGPSRGMATEDELFRDYVVPVTRPDNLELLGREKALELDGFPLLHNDSYELDPAGLTWPAWIATFGHRSQAPGRGIHYRTIGAALDSLLAGTGMGLCGLSLTAELLDAGRLATLFPLHEGSWTGHTYRVGFREGALRRSQTAAFRDWLLAEAVATMADLQDRIRA